MIVIAVLCLLVAAALIAFMLFVHPNQPLSYSFFAGNFTTRPFWVFVAGAVTLLLIGLGVDLIRRGTRRKVARRREIRQLRQQSPTGPVAAGHSTGHPTGPAGQDLGTGSTPVEETYVRETRTGTRTDPTDQT